MRKSSLSEVGGSVLELGGSMSERGGSISECGGRSFGLKSGLSEVGGSVSEVGGSVLECGGSMSELGASSFGLKSGLSEAGGSMSERNCRMKIGGESVVAADGKVNGGGVGAKGGSDVLHCNDGLHPSFLYCALSGLGDERLIAGGGEIFSCVR